MNSIDVNVNKYDAMKAEDINHETRRDGSDEKEERRDEMKGDARKSDEMNGSSSSLDSLFFCSSFLALMVMTVTRGAKLWIFEGDL